MAHWPFENNTENIVPGGTIPDGILSENNPPAGSNGGPSFSNTNSVMGSYLQFDGVDDFVDVADDPFFQTFASNWSASAWFRVERAPMDGERFFVFETSGDFPISLGLTEGTDPADTKVQIFTIPFNSISIEVADIDITSWNHVLITNSRGAGTNRTLTAYLNGDAMGTLEGAVADSSGANGFHIGTFRSNNDRFFPGDIDEVALWNTVLTPAEAETFRRVTVVNTLIDEDDGNLNGDISFREAIRYAPENFTIEFDPSLSGGTIVLAEDQLTIERDHTIDAASLPLGITIDANATEENRRRVIEIGGDTIVSLRNLTITGGRAENGENGGGILNGANSSLTLTDCVIDGNQTMGGESDGGGIYSNNGNLTMTNCTISGNQTTMGNRSDGGGIYSFNGNLTMTSCTISGNQTIGNDSRGGGVFCSNASNQTTRFVNCTITNNSAQNAQGGGIYNFNGLTQVEHCTIVNNTSAQNEGAGVSSFGNASTRTEVSHSIISGNNVGTDLDIAVTNTNSFFFEGQNLIGTVGPGITGVTPSTEDVLLAPLGNYGGPTETMPPLPGSPAIEAATGSMSTTDQRGFARSTSDPDLGSVEADDLIVDGNNALSFLVTTVTDELDFANTDRSLREAILLASGYSTSFSSVTITFDSNVFNGEAGNDINLLHGELAVTSALTIDASDITGGVVIDGNGDGDFVQGENETRCFFISDEDDNTQLPVTLNNLIIQNGSHMGNDAGANIHNREDLTLNNCQILNGRAFGGINGFDRGGGIFSNTGSLTMTNCTVSGNQTEGVSGDGGGIFSFNGNLTMTSCSVLDNQTMGNAADGGGIWSNTNLTDETTRLVNCTIANNSAQNAAGGGVFNEDGLTEIEHCTIVGNTSTSGQGAGVSSRGNGNENTSTLVSHSIISGNNDGTGLGNDLDLQVFSTETRNNSFTFMGRNLIGTVGSDIAGVTPSTEDVLLAPLGNYGGPTETMPPLPGSPAIEAATGSMSTTDQRGFARSTSDPDLGSVEADDLIVDENDVLSFLVTTATDELDFANTNRSLREGILLASRYSTSFSSATITFDSNVFNCEVDDDINLLHGELAVTSALIIDASDITGGVVIDGNGDGDFEQEDNETRCFFISDEDGNNQLTVTLNNLIIQNGSHEGDNAGANIHNREDLTLTNCQILNGRAFGGFGDADGGGIYSEAGSLTMTSCTVSGNQTMGSAADGGGVFSSDQNLTMTSCSVLDNQTMGSAADGGGIYSEGNLTMTSSTISGNQTMGITADGGGIWSATNLIDETTRLVNCTITNNSAQNADGGGVYNQEGLTQIEHCTIANNTSAEDEGAGVSSRDNGNENTSTVVSHSIISGNNDGNDLAISEGSPTNSFTFIGQNLIGTFGSNILIDGALPTGVIQQNNPMLAPLGDFGGPTLTMLPLSGSMAIDAATSSTSTTDQRGFALFNTRDLGAVEAQENELLPVLPFDLADFNSDQDNDGTPNGIEFILGTDFATPDSSNSRNPSLDLDTAGNLNLRFGKASNLPDGITLIIRRSTTLEPDTFIEVARYSSTSNETTITGNDNSFSIEGDAGSEEFSFTNTEPLPAAFYFLEASFQTIE